MNRCNPIVIPLNPLASGRENGNEQNQLIGSKRPRKTKSRVTAYRKLIHYPSFRLASTIIHFCYVDAAWPAPQKPKSKECCSIGTAPCSILSTPIRPPYLAMFGEMGIPWGIDELAENYSPNWYDVYRAAGPR